ncbi:MAG TPA: hypothetical protein ENK51_04860 [Gammaproteobacteria bacterium]|nr:hypothetical protein [Gammaproteobacteria bacterium]
MTFRAPSPATYFISLFIAAATAGLAWLTLGNTASPLLLLAAGLLIGHFFGSFFSSDKPTRQPAVKHTPGHRPASSNDGETKSIYVGNVAFSAPREALQELFEAHGRVISVRLMTDRATRRPRGYGFVEMESRAADAAIAALDGQTFFGRNLRVNEAKQRAPRQN